MKSEKNLTIYRLAAVLILMVMFTLFPVMGEETLCYTERVTDAPSFHIYTGNDSGNNPIVWQHNVPAGILENVVRVGLYIEAYDVDYPLNDEHDRVFFNGNDLGLLEGSNNTWFTVEKTIPVSYIREGINDLSVSVDELNKDWKVTIRASEIRFYCSSAEPDFVLGITPESQIVQAGNSGTFTVSITPLNGFSSAVQLSPLNAPAGIGVNFQQNPLPPGGTTPLTITVGNHVAPGDYKIKITGTSGEIVHEKEIALTVTGNRLNGSISKSFIPGTAYPGDEVRMKISVRNHGVISIKDSEIWDTIPNDLSYVSDDSGVTVKWEGRKAVWRIPKISRKSEKTIIVRLKVAPSVAAGKIKNRAYLYHDSLKNPLASNTAVLQIRGYRVSIHKMVDKTTAKPGDFLRYTLEIRNDSAISLPDITVKDELDLSLQFISQDGDWGFLQDGSILTWNGNLAEGMTVNIPFKVLVRPETAGKTRISNVAILESVKGDLTEQSNTVWTAVEADPLNSANVVFRKKAEVPQARVGRITRFRFTIQNNSSVYLLNPVVEDMLPQGFSYVANTSLLDNVKTADPSGKRRLMWHLPSIKPHQTVFLRFQVVIGADARRGRNVNRGVLTVLDNTGQSHRLDASEFINVEASGIIFYSGVEGKVFLDDNEDGFFSAGDRPLQGIEVRLSTGEKVITPKDGSFRFEQLFPGEYAVGLNTVTLPEKFKLSSRSPVFVGLSDGMMDYVEFMVVLKRETEVDSARLQGIVYFDKNRNMSHDSGDLLLREFKAVLDGNRSTVGEWGDFIFSHVAPGIHTIDIIYNGGTIRQEVLLNRGKNLVEFPLKFTGIEIQVRGRQ